MLEFFGTLFFAIGFTLSLIGIGYGAVTLTEQIQNAARRREERYKRLIETLERIQAELRKSPPGS